MTTTGFRPSIHGWPFGNSYDYNVKLPYEGITLNNLGYCGGMCWTALTRFYSGVRIPRDLTTTPQQGQPLYDEIYQEQLASLPLATLEKIIEWQESPDQSHALNPFHSLGYRTQQEWPNIKARLDDSKPVTLTLIASSNDYNPLHLQNNHRVVAYGYEERALLSGEWVHGNRNDRIRKITVNIYDPNHPYNPNQPNESDEVYLSFFTGCDDNWICLRHSSGDEFHGFFLDDHTRTYTFADATELLLNDCVVTGIPSPDRAAIDLKFSWKCRFIPYYCVKVNGIDWQFNDQTTEAKWKYAPKEANQKQCDPRIGNFTLQLKVPRELLQISVRILDNQAYEKTVEVDARPAIQCLPYVHTRVSSEEPEVCDSGITDADLFIKDPNPTDTAVQALDTSPYRWVEIPKPGFRASAPSGGLPTTPHLETISSLRLGNIKVPIYAEFVQKNLALPITITGILQIGQTTPAGSQTFPSPLGQKIFDGFTNNPSDYDNDKTVKFSYQATDAFGLLVRGTPTFFFGKSIIHETRTVELQQFDPQRLARLEGLALELVERGLIDTAVALPPGVGPGPRGIPPAGSSGHGPLPAQPYAIDGKELLRRLHADAGLPGLIANRCKALWSNSNIWNRITKIQKEVWKQSAGDTPARIVAPGSLKLAKAFASAEQQKYDAIVIEQLAQEGIKQLIGDASLMANLAGLKRGLALPAVPHI